jgi:predicted metal-binding membrane protein
VSRPARATIGQLWWSPQASAVLIAAALAWGVTIVRALGQGSMSGSMGLGLAAFLIMWVLMMAAMMLPAVAPLSALYVRTFRDRPWPRTTNLVLGYLLAWLLVGVPIYALARLADHVDDSTWPARLATAAILAGAGAWQLTGAKDACLRHCRSPLGLLLHYGSFQGRLRDLRVGAHHGAWCIGCCWALMVLLLVFGLMNLLAMVVVAGLILAEKLWRGGEGLARVAGVALIGLAVAALISPGLLPGFGHSPMGGMS